MGLALSVLGASGAAWGQAEPAPEPYPVIDVPPKADAEPPEARSPDVVELETVVVIGEKVGRTLEQTTSSVGVVTARTAADQGIDSVSDAVNRTANASVGVEGDITLRGVNSGGAEGFGAGQPVISTYLDGVAVDTVGQGANLLDLFDLEQVEILRGAQSTSQGRNALAGAVVVNTREPTQYWDLAARMRLAELGERQYAAAGGGPIGGGFAFRLMGDYHTDNGFIRNSTRDDPHWFGKEDSLLRGKLAWRPTFAPDFDALLTVARAYRDGPYQPVVREADQDGDSSHRTARDGDPLVSTSRSIPASLRLRYAFSEAFELTSTTGMVRSRAREGADYDSSPADNGRYQYDQYGRTATEELRLNVRDWHGLTGLVGLYAGRYRSSVANYGSNIPVMLGEVLPVPVVGDLLAADIDFALDALNKAENVAVFSEFDYAITEKLTLIAGLRYDREHADVFSNYVVTRADAYVVTPEQAAALDALFEQVRIPALPLFQAAGVVPGTGTGREIGATYDALLPKLGLRYAITPELTVFLTYVEAYRAGGGDVEVQNGRIHEYDPEYTRTVETGFRAGFFDKRLQSKVNLYYTRWTDQQVQVLNDDGSDSYTDNAANSKLYGAEFENSLRVGARSSVYANFGYAHTRFDNYVTGNNDYSGNRFATAPIWTGGVGGVARVFDGWFGAASFTYTGTAYSTAGNTERERSDARRLIDARLGYERGAVSIYAFGRNLLDQDYANYRAGYIGGFGSLPGRAISYGPPRVFGVQIDLSFE